MPGITITKSGLTSRSIRQAAGNNGIRKVTSTLLTKAEDGGIFGLVVGAIQGIVGFLGAVISAVLSTVSWSLSSLFNAFINTVFYLWNFNWNITDEAIDQQVNSLINLLFNQLGYSVGNIAGYVVCGFLPSTFIFVFNEALGRYLIAHLGEQSIERIAHTMKLIVTVSFQSLVAILFMELYKNARRIIREIDSSVLQGIFGEGIANAVKGWGKEGSKPWSFGKAYEEAVDSIADERVKNFVQGFGQSFGQACIEGGFALIHSIEAYEAHKKLQDELAIKRGRYLEVVPDRSNLSEKMIVSGNLTQFRQHVPRLLEQHQLIENRDLGTLVGMPIEEAIKPQVQTLSMRIELYSKARPPFRSKDDPNFVTATINVPNVIRSALDWDEIKNALGGSEGYEYGGHRATVATSSGRQMTVYSISEETSKGVLQRLFQFTSDKPVRWLYGREGLKEEEVNQQIDDKPSVTVYPCFMTIISARKSLDPKKGKTSYSGNYIRNKARIPLWVPSRPVNFDLIIEQMTLQAEE
jgi:hypothetical protein